MRTAGIHHEELDRDAPQPTSYWHLSDQDQARLQIDLKITDDEGLSSIHQRAYDPMVTIDEASASETEPGLRGLSVLALVVSLVSVFMAATYFLSLLAYLPAAVSLALGVMSRSDMSSRRIGTAAACVSAAAMVLATLVLVMAD